MAPTGAGDLSPTQPLTSIRWEEDTYGDSSFDTCEANWDPYLQIPLAGPLRSQRICQRAEEEEDMEMVSDVGYLYACGGIRTCMSIYGIKRFGELAVC